MVRSPALVPALARLALVLGLMAAACETATDVDVLEIDAEGLVVGIVYLDTDGDAELDAGDEPLPDVEVALADARGTTVASTTTDERGIFVMEDVTVGSYVVALPAEVLGDSLRVAGGAGKEVSVTRGDTTEVEVDLSYEILTVEELRDHPVGRRVATTGIALNPRLPFGDGRVHLRGESSAIRALSVERVALGAGDSVRFTGRTARSAGQPVLVDVEPVVLVSLATIPVPRELTTARAATADGGTLDADLVRVRDAGISDTMTVDGDFLFTVDDGSGPVEVLIPSFLQINTEVIRPDTIFQFGRLSGLLVPVADGNEMRWRIVPRAVSDMTLETRRVDLALTMSVDFPVATRNDTVTLRLVARNEGGLPATGVEVLDSLPPALTLLGATPSRGTFRASDGRWTLGDMPTGASDTLTLRTRVTTALLGTFVARARFLPLAGAVDVDPSDDVAQAAVQVVPPDQKLADLQIEKTADRDRAAAGDTVTFTILALNGGPLKASAVKIADELPDGLTLLDADPSTGTWDDASGIWSVDSIGVGASASLVLRTRVSDAATGTLVNRASSRGLRERDPDQGNDTDTASVTVGSFQVSSASAARPGDVVTRSWPLLQVPFRSRGGWATHPAPDRAIGRSRR